MRCGSGLTQLHLRGADKESIRACVSVTPAESNRKTKVIVSGFLDVDVKIMSEMYIYERIMSGFICNCALDTQKQAAE